jgi:exonuclease III
MLEPGSSMHPRAKFRVDLLAFIKELQKDGHEVILIGDFNEAFGSDPAELSYIASQCSLFDVLDQKIGT